MTKHAASAPERDGLGLLSLPRRMLRGHAARSAERRSLLALRDLDDHLLRDVGLTRADVLAITKGL